ncbi:MAG: hypothetical protein Q9227_007669 [Pyrenula ochraceoflavens]
MASLPSLSELLNPPVDAVRPSPVSEFQLPTPSRLPPVTSVSPVRGSESRSKPHEHFHGHNIPGFQSLNPPPSVLPTSPSITTSRAGLTPPTQFPPAPLRRSNSLTAEQQWRYYESPAYAQTSRPPSLATYSTYQPDRVADRHDYPSSPGGHMQQPPHLAAERLLHPESTCWSYHEGTRGQKTMNMEGLNPQWGTTKAGKPRKRLGKLATLSDSPLRDRKDETALPQASGTSDGGKSINSVDFEYELKNNRSEELSPRSSKRQKVDSSITVKSESSPVASVSDAALQYSPTNDDGGRSPSPDLGPIGMPEHVQATALREDPYDIDSELACHYINTYFTHINVTSYCMFPRAPFMHWFTTCKEKSRQDLMVLYSLLAMGSVFSDRPQHVSDGRRFEKIAAYALERDSGQFTLQLVHARLMLGLYYFAVGHAGKAWDLCGSALRAASALKLNLEEGVTDVDDSTVYDFNRAGLIECRRRTFWSSYIMDRFNGFCSGHLCVINNEDCLLRLPIDEHLYERQQSAETPFFPNEIIDPAQSVAADRSNVGAMAYHAQISSLWGDVLANIYRSSHRGSQTYAAVYESFYKRLNVQFEQWMDNLPSHLINKPENADAAIRDGYIGTYIALHALYHTSLMKLNRHCRWSLLAPDVIARNIERAVYHAKALLQTVHILSKTDRQARLPDVEFAFSTPFTSFSILTAVDILSAAGRLTDLPYYSDLVDHALELVDELAGFWATARRHRKTILRRVGDLRDAARETSGEKTVFATNQAMETTFSEDEDIIYSVPRETLFKALGIEDELIAEDKVLQVQASYNGGIGYI